MKSLNHYYFRQIIASLVLVCFFFVPQYAFSQQTTKYLNTVEITGKKVVGTQSSTGSVATVKKADTVKALLPTICTKQDLKVLEETFLKAKTDLFVAFSYKGQATEASDPQLESIISLSMELGNYLKSKISDKACVLDELTASEGDTVTMKFHRLMGLLYSLEEYVYLSTKKYNNQDTIFLFTALRSGLEKKLKEFSDTGQFNTGHYEIYSYSVIYYGDFSGATSITQRKEDHDKNKKIKIPPSLFTLQSVVPVPAWLSYLEKLRDTKATEFHSNPNIDTKTKSSSLYLGEFQREQVAIYIEALKDNTKTYVVNKYVYGGSALDENSFSKEISSTVCAADNTDKLDVFATSICEALVKKYVKEQIEEIKKDKIQPKTHQQIKDEINSLAEDINAARDDLSKIIAGDAGQYIYVDGLNGPVKVHNLFYNRSSVDNLGRATSDGVNSALSKYLEKHPEGLKSYWQKIDTIASKYMMTRFIIANEDYRTKFFSEPSYSVDTVGSYMLSYDYLRGNTIDTNKFISLPYNYPQLDTIDKMKYLNFKPVYDETQKTMLEEMTKDAKKTIDVMVKNFEFASDGSSIESELSDSIEVITDFAMKTPYAAARTFESEGYLGTSTFWPLNILKNIDLRIDTLKLKEQNKKDLYKTFTIVGAVAGVVLLFTGVAGALISRGLIVVSEATLMALKITELTSWAITASYGAYNLSRNIQTRSSITKQLDQMVTSGKIDSELVSKLDENDKNALDGMLWGGAFLVLDLLLIGEVSNFYKAISSDSNLLKMEYFTFGSSLTKNIAKDKNLLAQLQKTKELLPDGQMDKLVVYLKRAKMSDEDVMKFLSKPDSPLFISIKDSKVLEKPLSKANLKEFNAIYEKHTGVVVPELKKTVKTDNVPPLKLTEDQEALLTAFGRFKDDENNTIWLTFLEGIEKKYNIKLVQNKSDFDQVVVLLNIAKKDRYAILQAQYKLKSFINKVKPGAVDDIEQINWIDKQVDNIVNDLSGTISGSRFITSTTLTSKLKELSTKALTIFKLPATYLTDFIERYKSYYLIERLLHRMIRNPLLNSKIIYRGGIVNLKEYASLRFSDDIDIIAIGMDTAAKRDAFVSDLVKAFNYDMDDNVIFTLKKYGPSMDGEGQSLIISSQFKDAPNFSRNIGIDISFESSATEKFIEHNVVVKSAFNVVYKDAPVEIDLGVWNVLKPQFNAADKVHALISKILINNTRIKDLYDLAEIYPANIVDQALLKEAIINVFTAQRLDKSVIDTYRESGGIVKYLRDKQTANYHSLNYSWDKSTDHLLIELMGGRNGFDNMYSRTIDFIEKNGIEDIVKSADNNWTAPMK